MSVRQLSLVSDEDRGAVFSPCKLFRYRLWRRWAGGNHCLFVLANPSTADEQIDDPTMRRCRGFAKAWGYDAFEVVNIFAFRSTDPHGLDDVADRVGPDNDWHIQDAATRASLIVAAWGVGTGAPWFAERAAVVRGMLRGACCLGFTASGQPKHPLYIAARTSLRPLAR